MKKTSLAKEIYYDYSGKTMNRAIKIKFNKNISKSALFLSKKTGTLFHSPNKNSEISVREWSNKIYSKKINTKKIKYTSNNPIMKSRHYYSAIFINKYLKKKITNFCDYGTGEGNFAKELFRVNKKITFHFTEHSKNLFKHTKKMIKKIFKKNFLSHNGTIESTAKLKNFNNFDCASLLWTLCNCVDPLTVLQTIHSSLRKDGLIIISESSRILVPFKKPIFNFFVSNHKTQNTHPWYFSYNSLSNLLEISGFRIIDRNRYFDENDLVVIAKKMNKKTHKPIIKVDNYKKVLKFLKDWEKFSYKYNKELK